ncbi:MAG TPA: glycine oxidase ThiO [Terriglobales bacterium]|nr:glycine oxidase ThiO [Terriglobales bacterium]
MKSWDAIIIGAGIIGLSLAIFLRKQGLRVLVVERGEPGREASSAAAGMLVGSGTEMPPALQALASESARMYPEFAHELEDESGLKVDLRDQGTILISASGDFPAGAETLSTEKLHSLEPDLALGANSDSSDQNRYSAAYITERSVDPRALVAATIQAARHRGVDISSGSTVEALLISGDRASGVQTNKTSYSAEIVVNCAGAWAGSVGPHEFPVCPVKGQMAAVVAGPALRHVIRGDEVYLVPRSDGRIVIGSTLEDAGYNKQTDVNTIQRLVHGARELVPALASARVHEDWAGLRPGTPDHLPLLGETLIRGYFVAGGHYRDGILLAPVTAQVMTELILAKPVSHDLTPFSPMRF